MGSALRAEWTLAVDEAGAELLEPEHEERVRVLAARLLRQLPAEGLPEASALLAHLCEQAERDRSFRQQVALSLLANYLVFLGAAPEPALAG